MDQECIQQLFPSLLGLKRIEEISTEEAIMEKADLPILNKRGMLPRIRKKNPLFFDTNEYIVDEHVRKSDEKLKKIPTKIKDNLFKQQRGKTTAQAIDTRLKNLLKLRKSFNWVCSEFFYSIVDKPIFQHSDNDFIICMKESFPDIKKYFLTRTEWGFIRRMLGKPRRCSQNFYDEEIIELNRKRSVLRSLQQKHVEVLHSIKDIPNIFPLLPAVGTKVSALVYTFKNGIFSGYIDAIDTSYNRYLIRFDDSSLGVHFISDTDILINQSLVKSTTKLNVIKAIFYLSRKGTYKFAEKLMREYKASIRIKKRKILKKNAGVKKCRGNKPGSISSCTTNTISTSSANSMLSAPFTFLTTRVSSLKNERAMVDKMETSDNISSPCTENITSIVENVKENENETLKENKGKTLSDIIPTIVCLKKLLHYKKIQITKLRNMNTTIECALLYKNAVSTDLKRKYASNIILLEEINRDLQDSIRRLNDRLKTHTDFIPNCLQDHTFDAATELVEKCSSMVSNDTTKPVADNQLLNIIRDFMILILEMKTIVERDYNNYEVDILRESMSQMKKKLNPKNRIIFQDCVEIHIRHIQSLLIGKQRDSFIPPNNSKNDNKINGDISDLTNGLKTCVSPKILTNSKDIFGQKKVLHGMKNEHSLSNSSHSLINTCRFMRNEKYTSAKRNQWSKPSTKQSVKIDAVSFGRLNLGANNNNSLSISRLTKPAVFTVLFCSTSFVGATIWQYENMRQKARSAINLSKLWSNDSTNNAKVWLQEHLSKARKKQGSIRQTINTWYNTLSQGEKFYLNILFANLLVLAAWKVPSWQPYMTRYFCTNPAARAVCWPMFLSNFSHYSVFHFAANMMVLHSFCTGIVSCLGKEQFLAFYLSAGVISSFASCLHKVIIKQSVVSLGASGAIMGVIGYVCTQYPNSLLQILFLPMITFKAATAIKLIVALDITGIVLSWKFFDHAAHLGGTVFGICWCYWGNQYIWRNRGPVLQWWHDVRSGPSK